MEYLDALGPEVFEGFLDRGGASSALAGGIWEALLIAAAGMAVAIPAAIALSWFEGVIDRLRLDIEAAATRIIAVRLERAVPVAAE